MSLLGGLFRCRIPELVEADDDIDVMLLNPGMAAIPTDMPPATDASRGRNPTDEDAEAADAAADWRLFDEEDLNSSE